MTNRERKDAKHRWALNNPDKVREANRAYRHAFTQRTNQQAAGRMRRYRQRLRVTGQPSRAA